MDKIRRTFARKPTSGMGHLKTCPAQDGMSASPPKADIIGCERDVRYEPNSDLERAPELGPFVPCN